MTLLLYHFLKGRRRGGPRGQLGHWMGPLIIHKAVTVIYISSTGCRTDGPAGITEGNSVGARGTEKGNEWK